MTEKDYVYCGDCNKQLEENVDSFTICDKCECFLCEDCIDKHPHSIF